ALPRRVGAAGADALTSSGLCGGFLLKSSPPLVTMKIHEMIMMLVDGSRLRVRPAPAGAAVFRLPTPRSSRRTPHHDSARCADPFPPRSRRRAGPRPG